ncbi:MAG: hypothetical protein AB2A00_23710 [Myxococcota bacterium]
MSGPVSGAGNRTNVSQRTTGAPVQNHQGHAHSHGGGTPGTAQPAPGQRQQPFGDGYERPRPTFLTTGASRPPPAANLRKGMPDDATIAQTFGQPLIPSHKFLTELGATPAQREVLSTLAKDPRYQALSSYFDKFPGGNPIRYSSVPGLQIRGVERFGGYFPGMGTLAINPAKAEHVQNPQELADTIIHEMAHAAFDVRKRAEANGIKTPPWPLPEGATDLPHDDHFGNEARSTRMDNPAMAPHRDYMDRHYGPGASNPKEEWIDINHGTQQFIVNIIKDNIRQTGHGAPTITFDNLQ